MRTTGGFTVIQTAIGELEKRHKLHISCYGEGNDRRLTGHHETASIDTFLSGVANRGASIRIPKQTFIEKKGYIEDRRPASNMDPYVVTGLIAESTILAPEDQLRIISMQKGGDVKGVFERLARGINAVQKSMKDESGKDFQISEKYGYLHSCPTNLGTGMRASVHVDLPGWTKEGLPALKARCEELAVQPRGTRG